MPGDAEEKGESVPAAASFDNLNFIKSFQFGPNERKNRGDRGHDGARKDSDLPPCLHPRPLAVQRRLHRGRGSKTFTPHEVKTIITRAGENTKIILTGDIRQIDTPYLDEQSNGLTYVIDRRSAQQGPVLPHATLEKGENAPELGQPRQRLPL